VLTWVFFRAASISDAIFVLRKIVLLEWLPSISLDAILVEGFGKQQLAIAVLAIALLVGLLQALTQVQEQTVAFVPKIVAMILALSLALPWLISRMVQYSTDLISQIPARF
jgi:flagellar biosynthetic protein FliQ